MPAPTVRLNEAITDLRAWRGAELARARRWEMQLPAACRDIVERATSRAGATNTKEVVSRSLDADLRARGRETLAAALDELEHGCGFVVLDRIDPATTGQDNALLSYWFIAQMLGTPVVQNTRGTLLFDVQDTGADVAQGARFSITNARSSFHTDGAFLPGMPDMIGLFALRTARSGGENRIVSAYALHNLLAARHPDLLDTMYDTFLFDRRGEYVAGESPVSASPLFRWDGTRLTMRYLDYYIREGHRRADQPLTEDQRRALEAIDAILESGEIEAQFTLEPGQMLFANNHWILHDRNAFEDHPEPDKRRHYVRVWLNRN